MMNKENPSTIHAPAAVSSRVWWKQMNNYQWLVFILAASGWLFHCFDQQIFTMSRSITMRDLMPDAATDIQTKFGTWATSIFILGWATGGLIFGTLGDKWGRAKTMALTILVYAACTGLSGLAKSWEFFALFRFLTGAGVGGEFAVGAALVAEVMSDRVRPNALGALQALSALGNIAAAYALGVVVPSEGLGWGWRGLYYLGALPGLVAVFVFWRLQEPEKWVAAKKAAVSSGDAKRFGRIGDLFTTPQLRRNTIVGLCLAIAGQIGLWGVGFYSPELIDSAIPAVDPAPRSKIEAVVNAPSTETYLSAVNALDAKEKRKFIELVKRTVDPREKISDQEILGAPLNAERKQKMNAILSRAITVRS